MKKLLTRAVICMSPWALGACEKELISDEPIIAESSVSITTRSVTAEEKISFPVNVYVFNAESKEFVNHKKISDGNSPLEFSLPLGTYSFYAVGGADENQYVIPSEDGITEESEIILKEGKEHADLMTAHNSIEVKENKENDLTLNMERQVVQLTNVTINNVPEDISNIGISLSTSYKGITINGEPRTEWEHYYALTNNGNGEWTLPSSVMLLLKAESVKVTISMTKQDDTSKMYSYTCPEDIIKNFQINITATYQDNSAINIIGHITGTSWTGTKDITFHFGDNIDEGFDPSIINEPTPTQGTTYQDCYVLKVEEKEEYNEVLLLYKTDFGIATNNMSDEELLQKIENELKTLVINDISGWRLPNKAEVNIITNDLIGIINNGARFNNSKFYYYLENNILRIYDTGGPVNRDNIKGDYYRPVATLKFRK